MPNAQSKPTRDIVVFGATSFAGQLLCQYLADRHGFAGDGPEKITWAIAGRSRPKLDEVVASLGEGAKLLDVLVVDAHEPAGLKAMAASTKVVVSTVGPYALHGSDLVAACAELGTDYLDLAGETQWIRQMIDLHGAAAEKSGARLVPASGFDSIPSDLGVHVLQKAAHETYGAPATRVRMGVKALRGAMSGGTAASMVNIVKELKTDPSLRKVLTNPYSLCPPDQRSGVRQPNLVKPEHDEVFDRWLAPFIMAAINTRVVHRTNALLGYPYNAGFVYDEAMMTGKGPKGAVLSAGMIGGLGAFMGALAVPGLGGLVAKVLPDAGEGPSPEAQEKGFFDMRFHGTTAAGEMVTAKVTGDRDPGYGSTAKMLGEAAVCMARDVAKRKPAPAGGFGTPASLFGDDLVTRLEEHAGLTFEAS